MCSEEHEQRSEHRVSPGADFEEPATWYADNRLMATDLQLFEALDQQDEANPRGNDQ